MRRKKREKFSRMTCLLLVIVLAVSVTGCHNGPGGAESSAGGSIAFGTGESDTPDSTEGESDQETEEPQTSAGESTVETPPVETETEKETEPPIVFTKVEETVYTTDRLNIRLEPSTDAQILRTMYMGEKVVRTGVSEEWSRILYNGKEYYAASAYLSTEPVIANTLSGRVEQLLNQMDVAAETDQLVLAVGNNDGSDQCTVYYYEKTVTGNWNKRFEVKGFWGMHGVKKVIVEADGCTPVGCFPFRFAYGINDDPGSVMEYKKATPTAYMVDDVNSKYYNLWVDTEDPGIVKDWKTAEHVIDFPTSYNYGLFIDNNPDCNPTQGSSVICIHCTSPRGFSPGCINIPEENILTLVTELDYDSRIVIVYGVEDLAEY